MKFRIVILLITLMICTEWVCGTKYGLTQEENKWLQKHRTIKIGVSRNWSPYELIDSTNQYSGIIGEFFSKNCQLLGIEFQVDTLDVSWERSLKKIEQKQIDVLPGVVNLPERGRYMLFTQNYLEVTFVIVSIGQHQELNTLTTLKGMRVVCEQGWATIKYVRDLFPDAQLTETKDIDSTIEDLITGKADVAVLDISTFNYLRETKHWERLRICSDISFQLKIATGIRNDWPELMTILNKVYRANTETMLNEIKGRWTNDKGHQHELIRKRMLIGGVILMVLIIVFLITIYRLSIINSIKSRLILKQREESITQGKKYMLLENIFASSFKTAIDAELILKNGSIIAFNQKALETFDVSEQDLLEKKMFALFPDYQPDGRRSSDKFDEILGDIAEKGYLLFDWVFNTHNQSSTFLAEVHYNQFIYEGKTYNTVVVKDVTHEREEKNELSNYRQHLEKMVADKTMELEDANKNLQSLNTELDAANEELNKSNVELLHIKERLEQTNDALLHEIGKHLKTLEQNEVLEETLKQFIEQSADGIIITNGKGEVEAWNQAMVEITGFEKEQVVGSSFKNKYTNEVLQDRQKQMVDNFFASIENGTANSIKFEVAITTRDKKKKHIHVTLFPIATKKGYFAGSIVADITQRKAIAAELEDYRIQLETIIAKNSEKLVQLSERFNEVYSNSSDAIVFIDVDQINQRMRIFDMNLAAMDLFHVTPDMIQNGLYAENIVEAIKYESFVSQIAPLLMKGQSVTFTDNKDTGRGYWETSLYPLKDSSGKVVHLASFSRNKTADFEQKRLGKLLQSAIDCWPFEFWARDKAGKMLLQNKAFVATVGNQINNPSEFLEIPGYTQEESMAIGKRALRGEAFSVESTVNNRHLIFNFNPILIDGQLSGYVGLIIDISKRKKAEMALHESEELYRRVTVLSGHIVFEHYLGSNENRYIGAIEEVTGYTNDEFLQLSNNELLNRIHPDDRESNWKNYFDNVLNNRPYKNIYRYIKKNNEQIWIESQAFVVTDKEGKPMKTIGIMRDVTEQYRAQLQIKESEEKLLTIYNTSKDGIMLLDSTLNIIDINTTILRRTHYLRDEMIGKNVSEFISKDTISPVNKLLEGNVKNQEIENFEALVVLKNGETLPI